MSAARADREAHENLTDVRDVSRLNIKVIVTSSMTSTENICGSATSRHYVQLASGTRQGWAIRGACARRGHVRRCLPSL
jgi:hypothetical protein